MRALAAAALLAAVCASASCSKKEEPKAPETPKQEHVGPVQLDPRAAKPLLNKAHDAAKKAEDNNEELQKQLEGL